MSTSLSDCSGLLSQAGIRHHVDAEDGAIHVVFVTRDYTNARGERLAVVRIETPDEGRRMRMSVARAFPTNGDPAATCLALCRLAAETPLVGVTCDPRGADLGLAAEAAVEDGPLTAPQVCALLDGLIAALETWHVTLQAPRFRPRGRRAS